MTGAPKPDMLTRDQPMFATVSFTRATQEEIHRALGTESVPDGYIAGWASTPTLDWYNSRIVAGAFSESIAERGLKGPKSVKLLLDHDPQRPAGAITTLEYRGDRLWMEAQLGLDVGYVRDRYSIAKMVDGFNFSVGFGLLEYEFKRDSKDEPEYLQINKGDLSEVSWVLFPGNDEAENTFVKSRHYPEIATLAEFEKAMVACGLARSRNEAQRITLEVKAVASRLRAEEDRPDPTPTITGAQLDELTMRIKDLTRVLAPAAKVQS